jgi:hypothetical protein
MPDAFDPTIGCNSGACRLRAGAARTRPTRPQAGSYQRRVRRLRGLQRQKDRLLTGRFEVRILVGEPLPLSGRPPPAGGLLRPNGAKWVQFERKASAVPLFPQGAKTPETVALWPPRAGV